MDFENLQGRAAELQEKIEGLQTFLVNYINGESLALGRSLKNADKREVTPRRLSAISVTLSDIATRAAELNQVAIVAAIQPICALIARATEAYADGHQHDYECMLYGIFGMMVGADQWIRVGQSTRSPSLGMKDIVDDTRFRLPLKTAE